MMTASQWPPGHLHWVGPRQSNSVRLEFRADKAGTATLTTGFAWDLYEPDAWFPETIPGMHLPKGSPIELRILEAGEDAAAGASTPR